MNGWPGESAPGAAILAIALILRELGRIRRVLRGVSSLPELHSW